MTMHSHIAMTIYQSIKGQNSHPSLAYGHQKLNALQKQYVNASKSMKLKNHHMRKVITLRVEIHGSLIFKETSLR